MIYLAYYFIGMCVTALLIGLVTPKSKWNTDGEEGFAFSMALIFWPIFFPMAIAIGCGEFGNYLRGKFEREGEK